MCTTCGCGAAETRVEGEAPAERQGAEVAHEHVAPDGTVYRHAHSHGAPAYGPGHVHHRAGGTAHQHEHEHEHGHGHVHDHAHRHPHAAAELVDYGSGPAGVHAPGMAQARLVQIERDILAKNNDYATENRRRFDELGVLALNLVSSPGSGKTTLLVRTIEALKSKLPLAVIEGDQQTSFDAERIRATGAPAIQINTGKGCHLDAQMVGRALDRLDLAAGSLLLIENVGNLVCPAAFDLGEAHKVVVLSVTEGEDKPLKYPDMFRAADLMLLNKADLLAHLTYDAALAIDYAKRINPAISVIRTSSLSGEGFAAWLTWIEQGVAARRANRNDSRARRAGPVGSPAAEPGPLYRTEGA